MAIKEKSKLDSVVFGYTTNTLEDENKLLKEAVETLKNELKKFKTPPLMVCEIREILEDRAIVKIPNGNAFYVNISKDIKAIYPGDSVLCEQKNLTVLQNCSWLNCWIIKYSCNVVA